MTSYVTPALRAFVATVGAGRPFGLVWVRPVADGFELCHERDRDRPVGALRVEPVEALAALAQFTASGAFRPLKTAPNLVSGWVSRAADLEDLGRALEALFPGAMADWYATTQEGPVPTTGFREYVGRQTGMYRSAGEIPDALAAVAVRACCHPRFCCRRRLWEAPGMETDTVEVKSEIPCLEPCALMLEFARRVQRIERDPKVVIPFAPGDLQTLAAVLEGAFDGTPRDLREGDTSAPANPRRIQLLLEKLRPHLGDAGTGAAAE